MKFRLHRITVTHIELQYCGSHAYPSIYMGAYDRFINFFYSNIDLPPAKRSTITQVIIFIITPLTTLIVIALLSSNVPFYDQWRFVTLLNQFYEHNSNLESFWAHYVEPRSFPRLNAFIIFGQWMEYPC